MKQPQTMKCIFHDEISANNRLRPQDRLVHEHLFIDSDDICINCATCGQYFCKSCGGLVGIQNKTMPQALVKAAIG
jgi:hypothetical protein